MSEWFEQYGITDPYYADKYRVIVKGDCREVLSSVHGISAVVTDPPYELGFMGKSWDSQGVSFQPITWSIIRQSCLPGSPLLSFGGSRTQHRIACAIEDAGFEVRDCIMWVYGQGFPKSLAIGKAINKLETEEWTKIINSFTNLRKCDIIEVWRDYSSTVKFAETLLEKSLTGIGIYMPSNDFAQGGVLVNRNQGKSNSPAVIAEVYFTAPLATNTRINTVLKDVEAEIRQSQSLVGSVGKSSQSQNPKCWGIFTVQCDVREWLKENTLVNLRADEALKTLRGNKKYSDGEITDALCAVLTDILKLTILSQSKTFQSLDTTLQTECVSATTVITPESIMDNLISNTVDILVGKAVDKKSGNERNDLGQDPNSVGRISRREYIIGTGIVRTRNQRLTKGTSEWEGYGTGLKPAYEPIILAMNPLDGTFANNALKHGVAGLNIDECRVGLDRIRTHGKRNGTGTSLEWSKYTSPDGFVGDEHYGRFPANFIWGCPEDEYELKDNATSEQVKEITEWLNANT